MARNKLARLRRAANSKIVVPQSADNTLTTGGADVPAVSYVRSEYTHMLPKWHKILDCLDGEQAVKGKRELYLPIPAVEDDPVDQKKRYDAYICRAVFYNVASRTLNGMIGQVFSRDPLVKLPLQLQALVDDADGDGTALDQLAKKALGFTMGMGRAGVFADYPNTNGATTVQQQRLGIIRPTIHLVSPLDIINWRTAKVGARQMLTLVVIQEQAQSANDGFQVSYVQQWRVLRLTPAGYQVELWRKESVEDPFFVYETYIPKDANGLPLWEIPFTFIGPYNNSPQPNTAPLLDLCEINLAHYRNSADYEEMSFIAGQPTAWFSGLSKDWVDDVFKDRNVRLGSRAIIPLPVGAQAGLLQITPNSVPYEAMTHKEAQMIAMGANLIQPSTGNKTFGEAQMENSDEQSTLSACTKNVSLAMRKVIGWCYQFAVSPTVPPDAFTYDLNTDFPAARLTPNERAQLVLEWQQGAITFTELRAGLRRAGVATEDDAKAKTEGEQKLNSLAEQQAKVKMASAASGGTNDPKLNNGNGGGNQAGN